MSARRVMVLIRGLPGSGKSTLSEVLRNHMRKDFNGYIGNHEADKYFMRPDGVYDFNGQRIKPAHEWCYSNATKELVSDINGISIVSNTFTTNKEMRRYVDFCKKHNVETVVIRCTADFGSVHNVPEDVIQRMVTRFEPSECESELFYNAQQDSFDDLYERIIDQLRVQ